MTRNSPLKLYDVRVQGLSLNYEMQWVTIVLSIIKNSLTSCKLLDVRHVDLLSSADLLLKEKIQNYMDKRIILASSNNLSSFNIVFILGNYCKMNEVSQYSWQLRGPYIFFCTSKRLLVVTWVSVFHIHRCKKKKSVPGLCCCVLTLASTKWFPVWFPEPGWQCNPPR